MDICLASSTHLRHLCVLSSMQGLYLLQMITCIRLMIIVALPSMIILKIASWPWISDPGTCQCRTRHSAGGSCLSCCCCLYCCCCCLYCCCSCLSCCYCCCLSCCCSCCCSIRTHHCSFLLRCKMCIHFTRFLLTDPKCFTRENKNHDILEKVNPIVKVWVICWRFFQFRCYCGVKD